MSYHPKEPIDAWPFLEWCLHRLDQIERELNEHPAFGSLDAEPGVAPVFRMLADIGWADDTGYRRWNRWTCWTQEQSGGVERAIVEDALDHASIPFGELYPKLRSGSGVDRRGQGSILTQQQVRAAYVLYDQGGLSLRTLGAMMWQQIGYASPESCASGLRAAFRAAGLPRRKSSDWRVTHGLTVGGVQAALYHRTINIARYGQCPEMLSKGRGRCPRACRAGEATCGYHHPDRVAYNIAAITQIQAEGKHKLRWVDRESRAA